MEFVTKREIFHNGKLRSEGEIIVSNEKLDTIYPNLFERKGGKVITKTAEPIKPIEEAQPVQNRNE